MAKQSKQKVKRKQRMRVVMSLLFPDLHENKSYKTDERSYKVILDGKDKTADISIDTETGLCPVIIRLRTQITVHKMFRDQIDSTFKYRVGENFAEVVNSRGFVKRVAVDFEEKNLVEVLTNTQFGKIKSIL